MYVLSLFAIPAVVVKMVGVILLFVGVQVVIPKVLKIFR